jgi:hypothetical protein
VRAGGKGKEKKRGESAKHHIPALELQKPKLRT